MKLILASSLIALASANSKYKEIGKSGKYGRKVVDNVVSENPFMVHNSGGKPARGSCYVDIGNSYEGDRSETRNRNAPNCQNWETQPVNRNFIFTATKISKDKKYNGRNWNHNYCRNPDNDERGPWCMTTNKQIKYDYCGGDGTNFNKCPTDFNGQDCKHYKDGLMYAGKISKTANNKNCIAWNKVNRATKAWYGTRYPAVTHNYCRNVDNDSNGPWCYTNANGKEWGYCDIPQCAYESDNDDSNDNDVAPPTNNGNNNQDQDSNELTCGLRCASDTCNPANGYSSSNNIIGGDNAKPGEFPWQVQLRTASGWGYCGGSIVNRRWILSAAHCISTREQTTPLNDVNVAVGFLYQKGAKQGGKYWRGTRGDLTKFDPQAMNFGRDIYGSKLIVRPKGYDGNRQIHYDIALIQTKRAIHYGNEDYTWSRPACLPHRDHFHPAEDGLKTPNVDTKEGANDQANCIISGWGKTSHSGLVSKFSSSGKYFAENDGTTLQWVKQQLPPKNRCLWERGMLGESQVCVEKTKDEKKEFTGSCNGDSGGPLTCTPTKVGKMDKADDKGRVKMVQIGLTSYGSARACASAPSVYTRLTGYEKWIQHVIRTEEEKTSDEKTSIQYMDANGNISYWFSDPDRQASYQPIHRNVEATGNEQTISGNRYLEYEY